MGSLKVRPCSAGYKLCMSCPIKKLPFCIFCPDQIMGEVLTQTSYAVQNFSAPVGGSITNFAAQWAVEWRFNTDLSPLSSYSACPRFGWTPQVCYYSR